MPALQAHEFRADLGLVQDAIQARIVPGQVKTQDTHWKLWTKFCLSLQCDPELPGITDPVPHLQVFAVHYRSGRIAPRHKGVRSRTVEDALRSVGQTFARLGAHDIRLNPMGSIDFRIQRQLRGYKKADPPSHRVKPIPVQVLLHVLHVALTYVGPASACMLATADMITLAFFFLLRPGEYTGNATDDTPFTLADVTLTRGAHRLFGTRLLTASEADLNACTGVSLTFTTQKNGVRGEIIHQGTSGALRFCPVRATVRRLVALRQATQNLDTPLASFYKGRRRQYVTAAKITVALRASTQAIGLPLGLTPADISARSLRASGAMALLCAKVDTDIISLVGRWRSDEMMRYLHVQAEPIMKGFARRMVAGGQYNLLTSPTIAEGTPMH